MGEVSGIKTVNTHIGAVTTDLNFFIFRAPERCVINSIYLVNGTTKAASDSNYATHTVKNLGSAGAGTTSVATFSNNAAGGALTADVPKVMVNSTTLSALELAEGDLLQIQVNVDVAGTSQLDAEYAVSVNYTPGTGSGQ